MVATMMTCALTIQYGKHEQLVRNKNTKTFGYDGNLLEIEVSIRFLGDILKKYITYR